MNPKNIFKAAVVGVTVMMVSGTAIFAADCGCKSGENCKCTQCNCHKSK